MKKAINWLSTTIQGDKASTWANLLAVATIAVAVLSTL